MPLASEARIRQFEETLLAVDRVGLKRLLTSPDGCLLPLEEAEAVFVPALERIGKGWEEGRVALSEVYMCGRLCEEALDALPGFRDSAADVSSHLAIAVLEDFHLLGLRLVYSALHAGGVRLQNYGRQEMEALVERVKADRVTILLVSVLMLRSALRVRELRARLNDAGCPVHLVVGGAPFRLDRELWREVGADATSDTAIGAVAIVKQLQAGVPAR